MRSWLCVLPLAGCFDSPVPCDKVIHDEEDSYGEDCAELDVTSTIPFDHLQMVMGQSGVAPNFPGPSLAIATPAMLAAGESLPVSYAEFRRIWPDSNTFDTEQTSFVATLDGGGDGWDDRAVVLAYDHGEPIATGVIHLSKVERGYDSYLVGSVELGTTSPVVERWGLSPDDRNQPAEIPCVRAVESDRTTYFVLEADADCDGLVGAADRNPVTFDPP